MGEIGMILILLTGVIATSWIAKILRGRIALPLIQIAVGAAIGLTSDFGITLEPEMFFVLFLPPLLFLDGWRVPKKDLQDNAVTVLSLAFGLVFFTVLGVGLLLHLMIPQMPIAVCFALAAVLSPTDVVAATAMVTNVGVPRRMLRILEGEALFNDASGLVCLRLAVAAAMTGAFPFWSSLGGLAWAAIGGILIGAALTQFVAWAKFLIIARLGEETSSSILISLLTPYGAYLLADMVGSSGVLAAVAAGIVMSRVEVGGQALAITRIRRNAVWETLAFALNGSIFLLLGEQLPDILARLQSGAAESGHDRLWWLAVYVLVVTIALAALRFLWVWVSVFIWLGRQPFGPDRGRRPNLRLVIAMSTAGVRGAVTLAGALSLPLLLPDGSPFPFRDLVILIATGVILVSLVVANASLPALLEGIKMPPEPRDDMQERNARVEAVKAAITALAKAGEAPEATKGKTAAAADAQSGHLAAVALVADYYRHRLSQLQPDTQKPAGDGMLHDEERLHVVALQAERTAIVNMARGHRITTDLAQKLLSETDLSEAAFQNASDA